jgi:hypothetical protein
MKALCLLLVIGCLFTRAGAQQKEIRHRQQANSQSNSISAGINIPFGKFSSTHRFGFGLDYSWCHHRYGRMNEIPVKLLGFTFNAGADYYIGKKENTGYAPYIYNDYTYLHSYAGVIYNPGKKTNISLTAGPALGLYAGHSQFKIGVNLAGSYYLAKNIAIAPAVLLMKESDSDPLWAGALQIIYCFR